MPVYAEHRTPQREAHYQVAKAIRKGDLAHPSCFPCADCGGPAKEYDHRDYSKPLTVDPVCRKCNVRRGSAIGALVAASEVV